MVFRPLRMKCTHCDEAYTKTHDLYAHIRTHQHHTKCPHCGKILTCMATFVYHVRTHTTEKPYYCPCDGCDFRNAVKYNLKVHLACIRHGGKKNLKKYAKVLDLDVCEKSLRKRKDNSVHELGSRRSKKRRKLNSTNNHRNQIHRNHNNNYVGMNVMDMSMNMNMNMHPHPLGHTTYAAPNYVPGYVPGHNPHGMKQEEYDQFAAQLLFSLSALPPVFDPMQMNMDWNNQGQIPGNTNTNTSNRSGQELQLELNGNIIKTEDDTKDNNNNNSNNDQLMLQQQQLDVLGLNQYLVKPNNIMIRCIIMHIKMQMHLV